MTKPASTTEYLDGSMWKIVVYCYIDSDIVRQDNIDQISADGGKSNMIEVPVNYEKVKVSFKFLLSQSPYYDMTENHRQYVVAYTSLETGKNNVITITDNTMVGPTLKNASIDNGSVICKAFWNISFINKLIEATDEKNLSGN